MHIPAYLQCTKAVLTGFGLLPSNLEVAPAATARLGNWTVNRVPIGDRTAFLFMSDRTYLNFPILEGRNKVDLQDMPGFLQHGLTQLLSAFSVPESSIKDAIAEVEVIALTRATNRSSLAMHAAIVDDYAHILQGLGGMGTHNLSEAIARVNDLPRRKLEWSTSREATLAILTAGAA